MKNLLRIILPAFAFIAIAASPQAASARDWHSTSMTTSVHSDNDHDRGMRRGHGWRQHCRTVTVKHWDKRRHRMIYTQERVCR